MYSTIFFKKIQYFGLNFDFFVLNYEKNWGSDWDAIISPGGKGGNSTFYGIFVCFFMYGWDRCT